MVHTPVKWFDVLVYAAQSLALFAALVLGIFFALMIKRNFAKRFEGTGGKKAIAATIIRFEFGPQSFYF